jgi:hypothetical protein
MQGFWSLVREDTAIEQNSFASNEGMNGGELDYVIAFICPCFWNCRFTAGSGISEFTSIS